MPEGLTLASATEALAKIPYDQPESAPPREAEPPPDTEQHSSADAADAGPDGATGDTDGEGEVAPQPIAAPSSWRADAKEAFDKLPPEMQQTIAERESQRESEFQRRAQEFAQWSQHRDQHLSQAQQHAQHLAQLAETMRRDTFGGQFADIKTIDDVARMQAEDPLRFQSWQVAQMKLQAAEQALASEHQRQGAAHAQHYQHWLGAQEQALSQAIPEWKDQARASKDLGEIREYLVSSGVGREEAGQLARADLVLIARKAMLYDRARKAATARVDAPGSPTLRPGTAPGKGEGKVAKIAAAQQQFRKSGSLQDAARLLAARRGV